MPTASPSPSPRSRSPNRPSSRPTTARSTPGGDEWKRGLWESLYRGEEGGKGKGRSQSPRSLRGRGRGSSRGTTPRRRTGKKLRSTKSTPNLYSTSPPPTSRSHTGVDKTRINKLATPKTKIPDDFSFETLLWIKNHVECSCSTVNKKRCKLAKPLPKCSRAKYIYAKLDDAKNCIFNPRLKIKSSKGASESKEDGPGGNSAVKPYILRMEAKEEKRKMKLERLQGQREYDARQDKKQCPKCGTVQTYDEIMDRKKKCANNCGLDYRPMKTWSHVEKQFLDRLRSGEKKKLERTKAVEEEVLSAFGPQAKKPVEKEVIKVMEKVWKSTHKGESKPWNAPVIKPDAKTKKALDKEINADKPKKVFWNHISNNFFERMEENERKSSEKLEEYKKSYSEEAKCSFSPLLSSKIKYEPTESFLERNYETVQAKKEEKMKQLYDKWVLQSPTTGGSKPSNEES
jgi:hypothetical protein